MKRFFVFFLSLLLLSTCALADTEIDGAAKRGINPQAVTVNFVDDGVSPTTGLTLSSLEIPVGAAGLAVTGRYMPMLVQISNPIDDTAKAAGVGNRAPWGIQYADLIYEMQLHLNGETRLTALFSDVLPEAVGPIRSARMGHAWLREEWDCGFMYYGQQEYTRTNVVEEFKRLGATTKGVLFPGTSGETKPWKQFYEAYKSKRLNNAPLKSPNNRSGNAAEISKLIPDDHTPTNHAFKFADTPCTQGDEATQVFVNWGRPDYNTYYTYDAESDSYIRQMQTKNKKGKPVNWVELETQEIIHFANVIVQWTPTEFLGNDAPVSYNVAMNNYPGEGNADIFMNGRHIAGYWKRDGMNVRTVFYDANGEEIAMQRGKTMIVQLPLEKACSYQ